MNRKSLITGALLALGIISQASADNVVYLTGSTAFRSQAYTVLTSTAGPSAGGLFDIPGTTVNGVVAPAITQAERGGSSASGANYMLMHGNINGTPTYIDCAWSGSEAGIGSVCNVTVDNDGTALAGSPETWLKADGSVANGYSSANPTTAELESSSRQGDVALADTSNASSAPSTRNLPINHFGTVGVVTFTWAKNNNSGSSASPAKTAWSRLTNVTLPVLFNLTANPQTADNFTGNLADTNCYVYLVGRNKGSGTRANMMNDTTVGVDTLIQQFAIGQAPDGGIAGNNPDGATLTLWQAADANGGNDNGYESGGSVSLALSTPGSTSQTDPFFGNAGWIAIGYMGTSDAQKNGLSVAGNWLTENGVLESNGAIEQGQYSFWGNENLYGRNGISGYQATFGNMFLASLQYQLTALGGVAANHDAGIAAQFMDCSKPSDFAFPSHN